MKKQFSTLIALLIVGAAPLLGQETDPLNDPTNIDADFLRIPSGRIIPILIMITPTINW